jgi:four helix bundle protein
VLLNIAEGFGSSSRGVKRRHYEIARGSAVECIAIIDLASALGVADGSATGLATARTLLTRVAMMLAKLSDRFA